MSERTLKSVETKAPTVVPTRLRGHCYWECTRGSWSCPVSADLPCICRGPLRTERRARLSALSVLGALNARMRHREKHKWPSSVVTRLESLPALSWATPSYVLEANETITDIPAPTLTLRGEDFPCLHIYPTASFLKLKKYSSKFDLQETQVEVQQTNTFLSQTVPTLCNAVLAVFFAFAC